MFANQNLVFVSISLSVHFLIFILYLQEFQVSRHLVRCLDKEEFINLLKYNLFKKDKLDMWAVVRRFTAGLVVINENAGGKPKGIFVMRVYLACSLGL